MEMLFQMLYILFFAPTINSLESIHVKDEQGKDHILHISKLMFCLVFLHNVSMLVVALYVAAFMIPQQDTILDILLNVGAIKIIFSLDDLYFKTFPFKVLRISSDFIEKEVKKKC